MIHLDHIHSLSDFQRHAKEHLKEMKRSGKPHVLTVNGKAELVVQDARSYQKLLDLLEEADVVDTLRRRLASLDSGSAKTWSFEDAVEELGPKREKSRRKG